MMSNFTYSIDQYDWTFARDSIEDVIDSSGDLSAGDKLFIGTKKPFYSSSFISVDSVIDDMACRAEDLIDTCSFGNPVDDIDDEAKKELEDFLNQWALKHITGNFWNVVDIQELTITEEMMITGKN